MAPAQTDVATGLTHDLGFVVSRISWPAFLASEAPFFLHWSPVGAAGGSSGAVIRRSQNQPNPRQNGPMSADRLDQVGVLIV
jgi:hypothetical protein